MATKKRKMPKSKFMMGELKGAKMPRRKTRTQQVQEQMGSAASGIKTDAEKRKIKARQGGKTRKIREKKPRTISKAQRDSYKSYRKKIGKGSAAMTEEQYVYDVPRYKR